MDVYQGAGLLIWLDADNYVRLELMNGNGRGEINLIYRTYGDYEHILADEIFDDNVYLKLERFGDTVLAWYSQGGQWQFAGSLIFPDDTMIVKAGVHLINEWQENETQARFDYFDVEWCETHQPLGGHKIYLPLTIR